MTVPTYRVTIGEKIKEYRREENLSQQQFGNLIGVSAQAVYKWEQNVCCPDIMFLPQLAQIMRCTVDDFFQMEESEKCIS